MVTLIERLMKMNRKMKGAKLRVVSLMHVKREILEPKY